MQDVKAHSYRDISAGMLLATTSVPRKALLLDRDGVINIDHGYVCKPEDTEWVPGIFETCMNAQQEGRLIIVITNQSGIARGYYNTEEFISYTAWMHSQFASKGTPLTATYYCPHHPDATIPCFRLDCDCRKPKPGMIFSAATDFQLDLSESIFLGDKPSDLEAARSAGVGKYIMMNNLSDRSNSERQLK